MVDTKNLFMKTNLLNSSCITKIRRNHIITSCIIKVKITTNLTNLNCILATIRACFFGSFSSFTDEKLSYKYYNKRITTRDNGNVQSHDQEESKLNSTINANWCSYTFT